VAGSPARFELPWLIKKSERHRPLPRDEICHALPEVLLTAPRLAHSSMLSLVAADEGATIGCAVSGLSTVIVGPGWRIEPDDQIVRAMLLCLAFGREIH